jgi:flagellar protein FliO/FliZ
VRAMIIGIALSFALANAASGAALKTVESSSDQNGFTATLDFDEPVQSQTLIHYENNYIQIDLRGAGMTARREILRIKDDVNVRSVVISQYAPDVVRVRMMLKDAADVEKWRGHVRAEHVGSSIQLTLDQKAPIAEEEAPRSEETEAVVVATPEEILAVEIPKSTLSSAAAPILKAESEIPVLTKTDNQSKKAKDPISRLFMSLGVVVAIAGVLILGARAWAKRRSGLKTHHQIKVLTQFSLGPKKGLAIIRVAGESILIGITDHNISMIKSLALLDDDLPMDVPQGFANELEEQVRTEEAGGREDFSFGTVKDVVASRIREMRSL